MKKLAYIDETGLHLPDYPTVLETIHAQWRSIFGQDIYLEADSQDGQLAAVFALAIFDAFTLAGSVYQAFSPATAQGAGLSRMVTINGIRRQGRSHSTATLRVVGEAGTLIKNGRVEDASRRKWALPPEVLIPFGGEAHVTATAQDAGDIRASAGDICKIATPCRGWQRVDNPLAATPGRKVEIDAELRRRQAFSTALPSRTVLEGTVGAVAQLTGVTRLRAYENDQNGADVNGLPGHSIALVVEGGDTQTIADAIAAKKTPGTYTHGDTTVRVVDGYGVPNTIRFFRPVIVDVQVSLTIRALPGYVSTTGEAIKAALPAYVNGLSIGEDVLLAKLYVPGNLGNIPKSAATFDILSLTMGRVGQTLHAANIDVAFSEVAKLSIDNINLTEAE